MAPSKVIQRLPRCWVTSKASERDVIGDVVEMWITSEWKEGDGAQGSEYA